MTTKTTKAGWVGRAEYSSQDRADYYRNANEELQRELQRARKANDDLIAALRALIDWADDYQKACEWVDAPETLLKQTRTLLAKVEQS